MPLYTEWYPGAVRPVRKGVYQRRDTEGFPHLTYSYWTGKVWAVGFSEWDDLIRSTPEADAVVMGRSMLPPDAFEWRGLQQEEQIENR